LNGYWYFFDCGNILAHDQGALLQGYI